MVGDDDTGDGDDDEEMRMVTFKILHDGCTKPA
jgi:hypothetical protein